MPCFLGDYPGAASNREFKLTRAVNSFLSNKYENKILIIVSDGCPRTNWIYQKQMSGHKSIYLVKLEKQPLFSGNVRQAGINRAKELKTDVICYLDSDDIMIPTHIGLIAEGIGNNDWIYFNDMITFDPALNQVGKRIVELKHGSSGTSSIAHKIMDGAEWTGCDGYSHDWTFIQKLMLLSDKFKKTEGGYIIMHTPGQTDF